MSDSEEQKIVHIHLPKEESFKTTLTAGEHELIADEPLHVEGGQNLGPDPYDLLLMALGSCTVMTVKMYAQRKGWEVGEMYMELKHNKSHVEDCKTCDKPSSKIDLIEKELIIKGDLTDEQQEKLLEISKKCPVHRSLLTEVRIESTISIQ
ncbi:MAG: OsmC family protein [Balneolaceae bacterium]|nr:OsmC family protein [Balneolaceae bacterium]MBO6547927.1 OsmC family protein [Balneolaceae bacterium]MBO6648440.1 OsmC family protein [Balneolaceae bacterium]